MPRVPVVLVPCTRQADIRGTPGHFVRETYIRALAEVAGAQPVLVPVNADFMPGLDRLMEIADGILLPGAGEHVDPALYGAARDFPDEQLARERDAAVMKILKAAAGKDLPVLAICRGFQEMNVFHGGTLHQYAHAQPGKRDHRRREGMPVMESYRTFAHGVVSMKGGLFEKWGLPAGFQVNSVHEQGANDVGKGLHVEAVSDDGLVEAVSVPGRRFALALQWHPEGTCAVSAPDKKIFEEFGRALRD